MKKILLSFMMLAGMVSAAWAQVDNVKLFVSGEGATKEEATTKALRSAIEQAFGVFVSANTEILNDELVKDEIATVASGNIQNYDEVSTTTLPNGQILVQIEAVVSTSKLTTYARGKGSKCEFAGALLGQNIKLAKLNQINSERAIYHMFSQCDKIIPYMYNYSVNVKNAKVDGEVTLDVMVSANSSSKTVLEIVENTLKGISMSEAEKKQFEAIGIKTYQTRYNDKVYYLYNSFPWDDFYRLAGKAFYMKLSDNLGHEYFIMPKRDEYSKADILSAAPDYAEGQYGKRILTIGNPWLHLALLASRGSHLNLENNKNIISIVLDFYSRQKNNKVKDFLQEQNSPTGGGSIINRMSGSFVFPIKLKYTTDELISISGFEIERDSLMNKRLHYVLREQDKKVIGPCGSDPQVITAPSGQKLKCSLRPGYGSDNPSHEKYGVIVCAETYDISGTLTIPSYVTYKGKKYPVVGIAPEGFFGCGGLKKVILPNTVKVIYQEAFKGCTGLEEIVISPNLKLVEKSAFQYCKSLKQLDLSKTKIPDGDYLMQTLFNGCVNLESVLLPPNIKVRSETLENSGFVQRGDKIVNEFK